MNSIEKQISIIAAIMAVVFILVSVTVFLIGVLGGEIGAIFVKVLLAATFIILAIGGIFFLLREEIKDILEGKKEEKDDQEQG